MLVSYQWPRSRVAAETAHGGSSVTNLHLADIAQWKSFGARSNALLSIPQARFPGSSSSPRLECDVTTSAAQSAKKLQPHDVRLLIVIPAVAQEGKRLIENLREWGRDRQYPCSDDTGDKQRTDLMLLFSRKPAETPSWLQAGSEGGGDQAFAALVGEAAKNCFGSTTVRFANLTAAQEFYQGVRTLSSPPWFTILLLIFAMYYVVSCILKCSTALSFNAMSGLGGDGSQ